MNRGLTEIVDEFLTELTKDPERVMMMVKIRLSCSDVELKLLRADPLKQWFPPEGMREPDDEGGVAVFPFETAQGVRVKGD